MSISPKGVQFYLKNKKSVIVIAALACAQFVLSFFLYVSLAAHLIWPEKSKATVGIPQLISYEGRLTDASGNALGGSGTPYCFRFSLYDSATAGAGNKLWPSGTPSNTTAVVTNGIFNALVGQADTLNWDFYDNNTVYLDVQVNSIATTCTGTWEDLGPRQQLAAASYALNAQGVYGTALKTMATTTATSTVQLGTGAGSATPVYLDLDVKNTADYIGQACSPNGMVWYNSATSMALVCEAGTVRNAGVSGTTTIAAVGVNTATPVSVGSVVFSNANNVSFGLAGSTITASAAAGAAGVTGSVYANLPFFSGTQSIAPLQSTSVIFPFTVPYAISGSYLRFPISMSAQSTTYATTANTTFSGSILNTFNAVIYQLGSGASSMSLQSVASASIGMSQQYSLSANSNSSQFTVGENITYPSGSGLTSNLSTSYALTNASFAFSTGSLSNFTGLRYLDLPFAQSLSAGAYWMAFGVSSVISSTATGGITAGRVLFSNLAVSQVNNAIGFMGSALNASNQLQLGVGSFTTNGAAGTQASIALSQISSSASHNQLYFQIIRQS
jgi:hypothetical protein